MWRFYIFYNRPETSDFTFTWSDFQEKVNGQLIGNLSNLVNRTLTFVNRFYKDDSDLFDAEIDTALYDEVKAIEANIDRILERSELREGLRQILALSSVGNKAFQDGEPWKARNENPEKAKSLLKTLLYVIRDIGILIEPYMPHTSQEVLSFVGSESARWNDLGSTDAALTLREPTLLFEKLEDERIAELRERFSGSQDQRNQEMKEELSNGRIFAEKVILKVARITEVEKHPNGDRLYILTLDVNEDEERTIVSSIVPFYTEEELLNRKIVLVSNMKPSNFRGVKSRGMLLAANDPEAEEHTTCEVVFADDFETGAILEVEGFDPPQTDIPYVKADLFFSFELYAEDGVVKVDGRPIGKEGRQIKTVKYLNGPVN